MIWELLEILDNPDNYALRVVDGEIQVREIEKLTEKGCKVVDLKSKDH